MAVDFAALLQNPEVLNRLLNPAGMSTANRLMPPPPGGGFPAMPPPGVPAQPAPQFAGLEMAGNGPQPQGQFPPPPGVDPMPTQATKPGFMDRYRAFVDSDRGQALADMFAGWAMGSTPNQSLGLGAQMMREGKQTRQGKQAENQTIEWLKKQGMDEPQARLIARDRATLGAYLQNMMGMGKGGPQPTDDMREYEMARAQGYTGTMMDFMKEMRRAGAAMNNVNVNNGENAFDKKNAENLATRFADLATEGQNARANLGKLQVLRSQIDRLPGGFMGGAQGIASSWGIKLGENADAVEAAQAVINQLVPTQRPPGSGTMSDRDVSLFKSSLPQLSNTPEGNKIILDTMQAMAEYQMQVGEIAEQVQMQMISKEDGLSALRALPDPMKLFNEFQKRAGGETTVPGYRILGFE